MRHPVTLLGVVRVITIGCLALAWASAQDDTDASGQFYKVKNLVSDVTGQAPFHDAHLKNPWGLSKAPGGPWWVADNNTGVSTVYTGTGSIINLVVTIPPFNGTVPGSPSGTVYHPTLGAFLFCTEDGTISEWIGGNSAVIKFKQKGAAYEGMTLAVRQGAILIYVANGNDGIDVFDHNFKPVSLGTGAFTDPKLPKNVAPYNVQAIGHVIYVAYTGIGGNFVDAFDVNGHLMLRFATGAFLNNPWGIAMAPSNFGVASGKLLVGNLGTGKIAIFDPTNGTFHGFLNVSAGKPLVIQDLWAIAFGDGGSNGPTNSLFFTAGTGNYAHGTFGVITHL
jgi:uncharacterized protein (TIGR03118 family)